MADTTTTTTTVDESTTTTTTVTPEDETTTTTTTAVPSEETSTTTTTTVDASDSAGLDNNVETPANHDVLGEDGLSNEERAERNIENAKADALGNHAAEKAEPNSADKA